MSLETARLAQDGVVDQLSDVEVEAVKRSLDNITDGGEFWLLTAQQAREVKESWTD